MAHSQLRLAHVSSDEDNRPPDIRGPARRFPPRHVPPRTPDIKEVNIKYEAFFGVTGGFTWNDIRRFVVLESDWPVQMLPRSIFDGSSLRLFVWAGKRPTPTKHWEQVVIRLGPAFNHPDIQSFFLRYARAVLEPSKKGLSRRCPLCASMILCFAVYDHGMKECPIRKLSTVLRFRFLCVNSVAFCPRCNSRSTTHYECTPLPCQRCDSNQHTTATGFCLPDAPPELESVDEYRIRYNAQIVRRQHYTSVRELARSGLLEYRLTSDTPYTEFLGAQQPLRGEIRGLYLYVDSVPPEFPPIADWAYTDEIVEYPSMVNPEFHHDRQDRIPRFDFESVRYLEAIGEVVNALRANPDAERTIQLPNPPAVDRIPTFQRRIPAPLEMIQIPPVQNQQRVRPAVEIMPHPASMPEPVRPPPAVSLETYNRDAALGIRTTPRNGARDNGNGRASTQQRRRTRTPPPPMFDHPDDQPSSSNQVGFRARGSVSLIRDSNVEKRMIHIKDLDIYPSPSAIFQRETYETTSGQWSDLMNQRDEEENRANSVLQFNSIASQLASSEATIREPTAPAGRQQGPADIQALTDRIEHPAVSIQQERSSLEEANGRISSASKGSTETGGNSQDSGENAETQLSNQRESNLEEEVKATAVTCCHEPIRVKGVPARPTLQIKAFNTILDLGETQGAPALVVRIRALQFVLTAQEDSRTEIFHQCSHTTLRGYYQMLIDVGKALVHAPLIVAKLEKTSKKDIFAKLKPGRDILSIPTIDLWLNGVVANTMRTISGIHEFGHARAIHTFRPAERRRWFDLPPLATNNGDPEQQIADEDRCFHTYQPVPVSVDHDVETLIDAARERLPTSLQALSRRIDWLSNFLLSGDTMETYEITNHHKIDYVSLLRSVLNLKIYVSTNLKKKVSVNSYYCAQELAAGAAFGHAIVIPTPSLFAEFPWLQWQAFLQTAWQQVVDILMEETQECDCNTPAFQEDPAQ
ncbi:hypothetical protein CRE_17411 [Caenorhabditis remanei]|uniref:Uncharacterized protein n=1 Tax=Caenorhabditis remanei TaxID=31234 RepID=E3N285_CAERE|nr:hypothetical protein CRE_17411 [Caenorhabditis remanei]